MFVKTFKKMSPSELKLPKLHSWVYHIIDSIRSFGAVNGYTTETYESLHKEYVKNPYRLSNKKNIEVQIMQTASINKLNICKIKQYQLKFLNSLFLQIRRQSIANATHRSSNLTITPRAFKFTAKLFEFPLENAHDFFVEHVEKPNINNKMKSGFNNFLECLNLYEIITDEGKVTIYGSVIIENGAIMRATNSYYGRSWFSNVSVRMDSDELFDYTSDQGSCYGQVP